MLWATSNVVTSFPLTFHWLELSHMATSRTGDGVSLCAQKEERAWTLWTPVAPQRWWAACSLLHLFKPPSTAAPHTPASQWPQRRNLSLGHLQGARLTQAMSSCPETHTSVLPPRVRISFLSLSTIIFWTGYFSIVGCPAHSKMLSSILASPPTRCAQHS